MNDLKDIGRASHASNGGTELPGFSDSAEVTTTEQAVMYVYGPAWRNGEHYVLGLLGRDRQVGRDRPSSAHAQLTQSHRPPLR